MIGAGVRPEQFPARIPRVLTRRVLEVILHHTWRPSKDDYKGVETIQAIYNYHTKVRKWRDIGYHYIIAPDGIIWLGRPIEEPGAHTKGRNRYSIGVCLIGNFDEEVLEDPQHHSLIIVLSSLCRAFALSERSINFHRDYAPKTCPGLNIDKETLRQEVAMFADRIVEEPDDSEDIPELENVPSWADSAVQWALREGIIHGTSKGLELYRPVTRLEMVVMLHRLANHLTGTGKQSRRRRRKAQEASQSQGVSPTEGEYPTPG